MLNRVGRFGGLQVAFGCILVGVVTLLFIRNVPAERQSLGRDVQRTDNTPMPSNCGIECVAFASQLLNASCTPEEVRLKGSRHLGPAGISLLGLRDLCQEVGIGPTVPASVGKEDLDHLPTPFIAHLKREGSAHFVVCTSLSPHYVQYVDPTAGGDHCVIETSRASFFEEFTGNVLMFVTHGTKSH